MTTSTKPYLVRGLYEWCVDQGFTPHIAVWVNQYTQVPRQYVQDEQIVLNIGPTACTHLQLDNDWVHFQARFGGKSEEIWIPTGHILSIFARENGMGMGFDIEAYEPASDEVQAGDDTGLQMVKKDAASHQQDDTNTPDHKHDDPSAPSSAGNFLKIIK